MGPFESEGQRSQTVGPASPMVMVIAPGTNPGWMFTRFMRVGFQDTLTQTWTMDHYETSSEVTTQNQSSATATITGPSAMS